MRGESRGGRPRRHASEVRLGQRNLRFERRSSRSMGPVSDNASSPGGSEAAAKRLLRTSNHLLAEFDLHLDGGTIGKLATSVAWAANSKLSRHVGQRSSRCVSS